MPDYFPYDLPSDSSSPQKYVIQRKGSLYNITGPDGRVFRKYQSARVVGPRWEELTHTPWPYPSSAYELGLRLWQLGIISREQVGNRETASEPFSAKTKHQLPTRPRIIHRNVQRVLILQPILMLPAPRIDLQEQVRLMQSLRQDPVLLFDPAVREALRQEVEYHLPQARWAAHLLKLLDRYDRRQYRARQPKITSRNITARHIAWQEQLMASTLS